MSESPSTGTEDIVKVEYMTVPGKISVQVLERRLAHKQIVNLYARKLIRGAAILEATDAEKENYKNSSD